MSELTIWVDSWGHKELEEYLKSLKGIMDVLVNNDEELELHITYDPKFITFKMIKLEILLFLNLLNIPSILAFYKHAKAKTVDYFITRKDICCEYCFKGAIEELFEIDGINRVDSNFWEEYLKEYEKRENINLKIQYDPDIISREELKKIEQKLEL